MSKRIWNKEEIDPENILKPIVPHFLKLNFLQKAIFSKDPILSIDRIIESSGKNEIVLYKLLKHRIHRYELLDYLGLMHVIQIQIQE